MKFLLCLLPVIAHAQIAINIQASKETSDSFARTTGVYHSVITEEDQKVFNLTKETLKNAVLNLTERTPTDVFLRGPTPWNDLYKTYSWQPVKTIIKPHKITVLSVDTAEVVLNTTNITNNDSVNKKEKLSLKAFVEKKVANSWNQTDKFEAQIDYNINVLGMIGPNFQFNSTYGQNFTEKKNVTVESPSVEFTLKPKSYADLVFNATRVAVTVEVEYWVMLDGYVAANNEVKLNGHHFWAYNVKDVLKAASLPDLRKQKEIVIVEFYTDSKIVVNDH